MQCQSKNTFDQKKLGKSLKSQTKQFITGRNLENSRVSELEAGTGGSSNLKSSPNSKKKKRIRGKSVIAGSQPVPKNKIWKDKFSSSNKNIPITKLSKILDQASTLKEKVLTPFWTQESKEISKKLWLPTETDSVDLISTSSRELSKSIPAEKSWFSIKQKLPLKKKLLTTCFPSSQYSLQGSMVSEVTRSNGKLGSSPVRTLKIRIFPDETEKLKLQSMFEQQRWYYNAMVNVFQFHDIEKKGKYSMYTLRDLLMKFRYVEEHGDTLIFQDLVFDENAREFPIPDWWERKDIHSRLPRGAVCKFTSSLNSAVSNLKNGNIRKFEMRFQTKKSVTNYLHFEDKHYPAFIRKIRSRYWFTTPDRKRINIPYSKIFEENPKGLEIIYEKGTDRYFIHCPVERNWFPEEDRRSSENQANRVSSKEDRVISLDPGIRKFLVGYDPNGKISFIGEGACGKLGKLFLEIDKLQSRKKKLRGWKRIKNLIEELHWKVCDFLVKNYDLILLPDFRTSQMVRKSKKLCKQTKRMMNMFSFYKFKEKLTYKCSVHGKKLYIVDESYTSKTCGSCGTLNDVGGSEVYKCKACNLTIDRDVNGSRNILLKNLIPNVALR